MPLGDRVPVVGILGGGQLARMLALAGTPLGLRFLQYAPDQESASSVVTTMHADFDDEAALREFASQVDVVTFESENVPTATVELLSGLTRVRPGANALAAAGDRWAEKALFAKLGIPTARFAPITSAADIAPAIDDVELPVIFKARRFGYDGKGQIICNTNRAAAAAWQQLGEVDLLCEAVVPFDRELSQVAVRAADGEMRFYPVAQNVHEKGILRATTAPAPDLTRDLTTRAQQYVRAIAEELDYVGVLALEMFQAGNELLANEMAPRVHNTGHWTIEGARSSQFENHLRALLDWPLGETEAYGQWVMVNLIGDTPPITDLLRIHGTHVHVYGKKVRPGRKVGHVNAPVDSDEHAADRVAELRAIVEKHAVQEG